MAQEPCSMLWLYLKVPKRIPMRKTLLITGFFLAIPFFSFSQTVPNGGFENWYSNSYEEPDYYRTSNYDNTLRGMPANVTKVSDPYQGSFAIQMNTITNGTDTSFGYFINGDPGTLEGGIPYTQTPTMLTGYYKCNIPAGDTGIFLVIFKQGGTAISMNAGQFYGTHNSYTAFSIPITMPPMSTPDTIIVGAASSNAFVSQGIPGSMLQIDSIRFNVATQPNLLNGSFESWNTVTRYFPFDWEVGGDTVFRAGNAHGGQYCLHLSNLYFGGPGLNPGVATTGYFGSNGPAGGRPYTLTSDTLVGWYKFIPSGTDSATVWVNCTNNATPVGGAYVGLPPAASWTQFSIPFSSFTAPDTLLVVFGAVFANFDSTNAGSVLYLDDVALRSSPLSSGISWNPLGAAMLYPNPASTESWLSFNAEAGSPVRIRVTDEAGRLVSEETLHVSGPQRYRIDCSAYAAGLYTVTIRQNGNEASRRLIKN